MVCLTDSYITGVELTVKIDNRIVPPDVCGDRLTARESDARQPRAKIGKGASDHCSLNLKDTT